MRRIAMHISWSFLDKRKGAIKAISAYDSMDFIVKHTDEEIAAVRVKMEGIGSPNLDGMPHAAKVRREMTGMNSLAEFFDILNRYEALLNA
jgi:hypothetical protein